jgi:hypothetical protein
MLTGGHFKVDFLQDSPEDSPQFTAEVAADLNYNVLEIEFDLSWTFCRRMSESSNRRERVHTGNAGELSSGRARMCVGRLPGYQV